MAIKLKWQDPIYRTAVLQGRKSAPNKLETSLQPVLAEFGFRYTGGGDFWVHRKDGSHNPDFKKTGERKLVEVWGDYWHRGENPDDLQTWYATMGYDCLILWESEVNAGRARDRVRKWLNSTS